MAQKSKDKQLLAMHNTLGQLQLVLLLILLFFIGGLLAVRRGGGTAGLLPVVIAIVLAVALAGCFVMDLAVSHRLKRSVAGWLRQNRLALLLILGMIAVRLPQFGTLPRNDSSVYYGVLYNICHDFTFTLSYWLAAFRLAGHLTYGYASLAAIPEFFFPGQFNNIWFLQTTLSAFAIFCIFDLLRRQKQLGEAKAFWGALMCGCCSMFLGLDSYFQMDFGTTVACIFVLWAMLRGKSILIVFFSFLLVLSKEFGIALFVGLFLGVFFYYFFVIGNGSPRKRFLTAMQLPSLRIIFIICCIGGLAVLCYLFLGSSGWANVLTAKEGETELGYVGFNGEYIQKKLVQLVCTNFVWLQLAVQVLCVIWRRATQKPPLPAAAQMMISGIFGAIFLYFTLSCAFVTYTIARYNLPIELLITIVTASLLLYTVDGTAVRLLAAPLALLFCVQGYFTVDPLMTAVFPNVYTGSLPLALQNNDGKGNYIGDYAIYNYQYTFQSRCIQKILTDYYDENTSVLAFPWDYGLGIGGHGRFFWDIQAQRWMPTPSATTTSIETFSLGAENDACATLLADGKLKSKAIIFFVLSQEDINERITRFEATLPDYFENLQRLECKDGLYGTMIFYTADIRQ